MEDNFTFYVRCFSNVLALCSFRHFFQRSPKDSSDRLFRKKRQFLEIWKVLRLRGWSLSDIAANKASRFYDTLDLEN